MISIIVPVYNLEAYLSRCIESIINQSYRDLQIILVDDGSTDGSGEICDVFAAKDSRITVIHKPNGGVSTARNDGLAVAKGEYVGFVDGDDIIAPEMYSLLLSKAESSHADLTICSYITETVAGEVPKRAESFFVANMGTQPERFLYLYNNYLLNTLCNKLFRRELIKLGFPVGVKMGEDLMFILHYMKGCKSICLTNECLYRYILRRSSATASFQPQRVETVIKLYGEVDSFCKIFDSDNVRYSVYSVNLQNLDAAFMDIMLHKMPKSEIISVIEAWCSNPLLHGFLEKYGTSQQNPYNLICSADTKAIYSFYRRKSIPLRLRGPVKDTVRRLKGK